MAETKPGDTIAPESSPDAPKSNWTYNPGSEAAPQEQISDSSYAGETVSWTASEFVAHEKSAGWYLFLALIAFGISAAIYLVTKDTIATGMVLFVALMFGIIAGRKPRVLNYQVGPDGITVGDKLYMYQVLKAFYVIEEGAISSVVLLPMRRFMPSVSLYYPPDQEQQILDVLGAYLPQEERGLDPVDRFMRKIRF